MPTLESWEQFDGEALFPPPTLHANKVIKVNKSDFEESDFLSDSDKSEKSQKGKEEDKDPLNNGSKFSKVDMDQNHEDTLYEMEGDDNGESSNQREVKADKEIDKRSEDKPEDKKSTPPSKKESDKGNSPAESEDNKKAENNESSSPESGSKEEGDSESENPSDKNDGDSKSDGDKPSDKESKDSGDSEGDSSSGEASNPSDKKDGEGESKDDGNSDAKDGDGPEGNGNSSPSGSDGEGEESEGSGSGEKSEEDGDGSDSDENSSGEGSGEKDDSDSEKGSGKSDSPSESEENGSESAEEENKPGDQTGSSKQMEDWERQADKSTETMNLVDSMREIERKSRSEEKGHRTALPRYDFENHQTPAEIEIAFKKGKELIKKLSAEPDFSSKSASHLKYWDANKLAKNIATYGHTKIPVSKWDRPLVADIAILLDISGSCSQQSEMFMAIAAGAIGEGVRIFVGYNGSCRSSEMVAPKNPIRSYATAKTWVQSELDRVSGWHNDESIGNWSFEEFIKNVKPKTLIVFGDFDGLDQYGDVFDKPKNRNSIKFFWFANEGIVPECMPYMKNQKNYFPNVFTPRDLVESLKRVR